jgi:hypothetical protein
MNNFNIENFEYYEMLEMILKECNRNSKEYKLHALQCFNKVLKNNIFQKKIDKNFFENYSNFLLNEYKKEEEKYDIDISLLQKRKNEQNFLDIKKELLDTIMFVFNQDDIVSSFSFYFDFINQFLNSNISSNDGVKLISLVDYILNYLYNNYLNNDKNNEKITLFNDFINILFLQLKNDKFFDIRKNSLLTLMKYKNFNNFIVEKINLLINDEKEKEILEIMKKF